MTTHTCRKLTEGVQSVLLLKINRYSVAKETIGRYNTGSIIKSKCSVDGFDWEICFYPAEKYVSLNVRNDALYTLALELIFIGGAGRTAGNVVTANLSSKILDKDRPYGISPYYKEQTNVPKEFQQPLDRSPPFYIGVGTTYSCFTLTVECTLTVFREPAQGSTTVPLSDLSWQLGELLCSQARADVEFAVPGESFPAHRSLLAARCPELVDLV
ncbi:unnamed protein product [Urochloa humidicola]